MNIPKLYVNIRPAVITGKPIALGGSQGRDDATGAGAYYCIQELAKKKNWKPQEIRVAIQGFGNAGQSIADLLHAKKATKLLRSVIPKADLQSGRVLMCIASFTSKIVPTNFRQFIALVQFAKQWRCQAIIQ